MIELQDELPRPFLIKHSLEVLNNILIIRKKVLYDVYLSWTSRCMAFFEPCQILFEFVNLAFSIFFDCVHGSA